MTSPATAGPPRRRRLLLAALVGVAALAAITLWFASVGLPQVGGLARRAPSTTALMRARKAEAARRGRTLRVDQRWVSYQRFSPWLRRAVLIAEDDAFFAHGGLDWNEMRAAARANLEKRRVVRGGSTITQQLAKNLYLGEERTPWRKAREILIARRLEQSLSKRRIFELYLNLIEWGDGVYGAEAAARRHFGVSASDLTPRQAALLAAVIINPRRYSPVEPAPRIDKRMRMILGRMRRRGLLSEDDYRIALGEARPGFHPLDWLFGPPAPSPPPADPLDAPEPAQEEEPGEPAAPEDSAAPPDSGVPEASPPG